MSGFLFAQDAAVISEDDIAWDEEEIIEQVPAEIKPYRVENRTIEVGILGLDIGFANSFISSKDIFQETLIINFDELKKGFGINFGLNVYPLFFNYNHKDLWGVGISFGVEAVGLVNLSGKMLSFSEVNDEKSDIGAAVFAQIQFPGYFHVQKFKIKVKPSLFFPIIYMDSGVTYTFNNSEDGTTLDLGYNMRVYSAWSMEEGESFQLNMFPGLDVHLGVEYPLSEVLGLKEVNPILDFDVGVDLINFPTVPGFINNYMEISGRIGNDQPIKLFDENGMEGLSDAFSTETNDMVYGSQRKSILRPFKMHTWAKWRPFEKAPVDFTPTFGFALSPLYHKPFSIEAGIKARVDFSNLFIASLEIGYYDRLWKNRLDFALNFRAVEFDLGLELRSQDFVKSWTGAGFAFRSGFKVGW